MKITKTIFVGSIVGAALFGGTVSAAVYHIADAKERVQKETRQYIDVFFSEMDDKIKADTEDITRKDIDRMEQEVRSYTDEKLAQVYQNELNKKTDEINAKTNQSIEELKKDVDAYIQQKLNERKQ